MATLGVQRVMLEVLLALLPMIALQSWFYGPGVLLQVALGGLSFWLAEWASLKARGVEPRAFLRDLSAPLAGVLFALCLPPWAPFYVHIVGALFAIVVAKHLYGGLGYNTFNPAMVGYAVVLISFSASLARFPGADSALLEWGALFKTVFLGTPPAVGWDAISAATALDQIDQNERAGRTFAELKAGAGWQADASVWVSLSALPGGVYLVWRRFAAWQVPLGVALGVCMVVGPQWLWAPDQMPSPIDQLLLGGLLFGAFFIATDPVSGAASPRGRLIFGIGVGALTVLIRQFGAYPDGVAFAVLLMNAAAPLLDRLTQPRVFGR